MGLIAFPKLGVKYSDKYFTEETIAWLLRAPKPKVSLKGLPPAAEARVAYTPESALAAAWAELAADPQFQRAIKKKGYSKDQAQADFAKAIAKPLPRTADRALGASLKIDYQTRVDDGRYVHLLNGRPILAIPTGVKAAATVSANTDVILYGCFIVIDVLSVVAAAASIKVVVRKEKLAKFLQKPLVGFFRKLTNPTAVGQLNRLTKAGKKIDVILKILGMLRGSVNLKTVVETFLKSLSWVDKAIAVLQLIGSILLLIGSAGASFAAKVVQLAGAIAFLIADIGGLISALAKK
ncbi:MAG: hypothetical protein L0Y71_16960 [Gemmataceae bacterium]|nr:hypothetical protein [Gemmataceae bacterium]